MGLRMKNFYIMRGPMTNRIFRRDGSEKPIYRGELTKKGEGAWTISRFKLGGGGLGKKKVGVDTLMHTMPQPISL